MRAIYGCFLLLMLPAGVSAQPLTDAVWERPAAGVFLGRSGNRDRNSGESSPEAAFFFESPVILGHRLRADVSRVSWRFTEHDSVGAAGVSDTVTLKNVRVSALKVVRTGSRAAGYAGGGYGLYRYEYALAPLQRPWRGGFHGVGGLEYITTSQRYAIDGEVRLHAINGPGRSPVFSVMLFKVDAALGVKMRF